MKSFSIEKQDFVTVIFLGILRKFLELLFCRRPLNTTSAKTFIKSLHRFLEAAIKDVYYKNGVLKNLAKSTGKHHLFLRLLFDEFSGRGLQLY